ncbi:TRAP transporter small permease [Tianweitania sediminis]|uniref:TRAP transporter small permease protein n=1 Tax=Tianweitania sediminis TaxID=1502156 RepID=A0A8J7RLQ3_9HYPH|nr:TRAP transporter small permease [Tianweitania sediminis]MBP0439491.1 TRAP transporter small permease [Tianweitania sediminis]
MIPTDEEHARGIVAGSLEGAAVACRVFATLLLALMCVLIMGQVVGRNVFNSGMPWADELARFCGVAIVFLCVPLLALRGQHIAVDMVPMMLPVRFRRWQAAVVELLVLAFAGLLLWSLYAFLGRAWKFATPTLGIPNWVFYSPVVVAMLLLLVISGVRFASVVSGRATEARKEMLP